MIPVFLDTVGLIALWDQSDKWHQAAQAAYAQIESENPVYITTSSVLLECGNAAARKPFRGDVDETRLTLEETGNLIFPTDSDWLEAWNNYRRGYGGNAGIVDQISFVVLKRLSIKKVFTNDRHFQAAGFEPLFSSAHS